MNAVEYSNYDSTPTHGQESPDESMVMLRRGLYMLRDHWMLLLALAVVLGGGFGAVGYLTVTPRFVAVAQIKLSQILPRAEDPQSRMGQATQEFLHTEMELLKGPEVLQRASQELQTRFPQAEGVGSTMAVLERLLVYNTPPTRLVNIQFVHEDPRVAVAGANAVLNAHEQTFSSKYNAIDDTRRRMLSRKREEYRRDLEDARLTRNRILAQNTEETLQLEHRALFQRVKELESQIAEVEDAMRDLAEGDQESRFSEMSSEQLADIDRVLESLLARRDNLQYEIDSMLMQGMGENHRRVQRVRNEVQSVEALIQRRAEKLQLGLVSPDTGDGGGGVADNSTLKQLTQRRDSLQEQFRETREQLTEVGDRIARVRELNDKIDSLSEQVLEKEAQIEQVNSERIGEYIETTVVPSQASPYESNKRYVRAAGGGLLGVGLAVALTLLVGIANRRFKHLDEAELELPQLLGSLPEVPHARDDPAMSLEIANNIHRIRARLQVGRGDESSVFSVTSPAQQAGKTSLVLALGLSYAAAGIRTLVVDADVVGGGLTKRLKAMVHQRLGNMLVSRRVIDQATLDDVLAQQRASDKLLGELLVERGHLTQEQLEDHLREQEKTSVGLLDACRGQDLESCVAHTHSKSLDVLPIGTALAHEAGSIAPAALHRVIQAARQRYDVVLIDSGPILGAVDATLAAAAADATLLIFSRNDRKALVDKAISAFDHIDGSLAGVVFNRALQRDIVRSSYGSVTSSVSRAAFDSGSPQSIDPEATTSFGPLARSVAMYAGANGAAQSNGRARPPREETDAESRDLMARP